MKILIVVQTILISLIITILAIVTIDGVTVRKAEISSVLAVEASEIVESYFEGEIGTSDLPEALEIKFENSMKSKSSDVKVTVSYANAEQGIVNFVVDITYAQPTGRPRLLSYERVYIKERPLVINTPAVTEPGGADPESTTATSAAQPAYQFIRTIRKSVYKTNAGAFVTERNGGLKADSIWRTAEYAAILDAVFS